MDETLRQLGELALGAIPTIALFLFVWISYRLIVHKALASALAERRERTVGAAEKAKADVSAAERKTAEYEQKIREARLAVFKGQENRRQQILEQKMMVIAEARAAAETMVTTARAEIQKEVEIAKARVQAESSNLAQDIIRAILRSGSAARQPALGGRG
jgi:F-type H+-transporting ATPase subunit b